MDGEIYGEFYNVITGMNDNIAVAHQMWDDPIGDSFLGINDNVNMFAQAIWGLFSQNKQGYDAVKQNVDSARVDSQIASLQAELNSLG